MQKLIISFFILFFIFGCRQPPSPEQIRQADYGIYPEKYKELVTEYITANLIDPTSPIFSNWTGPEKGWYQELYSQNGKVYYGYKVCVYVNAKNRMGGYTGASPFFVVINNNQVVYLDSASSYKRGTIGEQEAYRRCNF